MGFNRNADHFIVGATIKQVVPKTTNNRRNKNIYEPIRIKSRSRKKIYEEELQKEMTDMEEKRNIEEY